MLVYQSVGIWQWFFWHWNTSSRSLRKKHIGTEETFFNHDLGSMDVIMIYWGKTCGFPARYVYLHSPIVCCLRKPSNHKNWKHNVVTTCNLLGGEILTQSKNVSRSHEIENPYVLKVWRLIWIGRVFSPHLDWGKLLLFHKKNMTGVTHISPTSVPEHLTKQTSWTIQSNSDIASCFLKKTLIYTYLFICVSRKHPFWANLLVFYCKVPRNPTEAIVLRQHRLLSVALIFDFVPNIKPATWSDCRNLDDGSRV